MRTKEGHMVSDREGKMREKCRGCFWYINIPFLTLASF